MRLVGKGDEQLLSALRNLVLRKGTACGNKTLYSVLPELYILWSLTSGVTCELIADALNESGCLKLFCCVDLDDAIFGARGSWQEADGRVSGAAANPPLEKELSPEVVRGFDSGALLD